MRWTNPKNLLAGVAVTAMLGTALLALPAEAATLRMAWSQDATGLDPHKQTAFSSLRLLELIYEPLVRLDASLQRRAGDRHVLGILGRRQDADLQARPQGEILRTAPRSPRPTSRPRSSASSTRRPAPRRAPTSSRSPASTRPMPAPSCSTCRSPTRRSSSAMSDVNASIVPASEITAGTDRHQGDRLGPVQARRMGSQRQGSAERQPDWAGGKTGVDGIDDLGAAGRDRDPRLAARQADRFRAAQRPAGRHAGAERSRACSSTACRASPTTCCSSIRRASRWTELKVRQAISCAIDRQEVLDTASLGEGKVTGPLTMPALATDPSHAVLLQAGRRQGQAADGRGRLCRRLLGDRDRRHRRAALRRRRKRRCCRASSPPSASSSTSR